MDRHARHLEERLGHVAVDMGLLSPGQVADVQMQMAMRNAASASASAAFDRVAYDLGLLTAAQRDALLAEEHRRRRLISGYEIVDILGSGLIAAVYLARQLSMERDVALKILHPRLAQDPIFVRNYIAEAQAVSRFHHPHIVQGFDAGESNGFYYFAHEYLPGGSMSDRLNAPGGARFSENRLLGYLRQTTSALKHAWAVAVYHGDINPGNLLLDGDDNIKLANLGVPRMALVKDANLGGLTPGSVRSGPGYAAPEQIERPEIVDARTDMYNLGATFYHISFGSPPFPGDTLEAILEYRRKNPQPSFSLKGQEGFSGKYLRLLHDMLETDPDKRPADPEELSTRLEMFHLPDSEELAWQVRRVAGPSPGTRRVSSRQSCRTRTPSPSCSERTFSLRLREKNVSSGKGLRWAAIGALLSAILLTLYFLMG